MVQTLGNLVFETSEQTQAVVEAGAVPRFLELLQSSRLDIRQESLWTLDNIISSFL